MSLEQIEQFELLIHAAVRLRRQVVEQLHELGSPLGSEDVAIGVERECVLCQGRMDAVLEHRADLGEGHAGAGQLTFVAEIAGWDPDGRESAEVEQGAQAVGVELVGLVDVGHHGLSFGGVGQERNAAGLLDLVDDPIPVADGFQGDGGAFWELGEEGPDGAR